MSIVLRRRLFQSAAAVTLIVATLGSNPPAAHGLPDYPTVWPATVYTASSYVPLQYPLEQIGYPELEPPPAPPETVVVADEPPPVALWPTDQMLYRLRMCESTNRYDVNTGNGFYGAVQWLRSTWDAASARAGYPDWVGVRPDLVPPEVQDAVTRWWWNHSDPHSQWPVCSWRV